MKKVLLTFTNILFAITLMVAQSAEGCDGSRYLAGGVFDEVTMTTVTYGQNTIYQTNEVLDLEMDIYQPVGDMTSKRPAIILAHGGSFIFGTRADVASLATEYAKMGYVAISISYRLYPLLQTGSAPNEAEMIDAVVKAVSDMKAAERYLRMDAATSNIYKVDTDYILVGGLSAGAITAMHVAQMGLDDVVPDYVQLAIDNNGGLDGTSGNPGYESAPFAVVNLSGGLHDKDWLDADDVPFISMHGDADGTVPYNGGLAAGIVYLDGSGNVHPVADAVGVANYFVSVPGGGHTNIYDPAWTSFESYRVDFTVNGNLFLHTLMCPNTVSTNDPEVDAQISVYPTPSIDQVTIDLGNIESMYDLVVYDQLGKVVYKAFNQQENTISLNKADFGAGLFVAEVRVMKDGIHSITRKVVFE